MKSFPIFHERDFEDWVEQDLEDFQDRQDFLRQKINKKTNNKLEI